MICPNHDRQRILKRNISYFVIFMVCSFCVTCIENGSGLKWFLVLVQSDFRSQIWPTFFLQRNAWHATYLLPRSILGKFTFIIVSNVGLQSQFCSRSEPSEKRQIRGWDFRNVQHFCGTYFFENRIPFVWPSTPRQLRVSLVIPLLIPLWRSLQLISPFHPGIPSQHLIRPNTRYVRPAKATKRLFFFLTFWNFLFILSNFFWVALLGLQHRSSLWLQKMDGATQIQLVWNP